MRRIKASLGVLALVALAAASLSTGTVSAITQQIARTKAEWQVAIAHIRAPGNGCYRASYPALQWHPAACTAAPKLPMAPVPSSRSATRGAPAAVGNGRDYAAHISGLISQATGSFQDVSTGITEKGKVGNTGKEIANAFSLQLNTQIFSTAACSGSGDPANCHGWQQFLYAYQNHTGDVFMQYWLINYDGTCPSGWQASSGDCYTNSAAATVPGGPLTAADLTTVKLSGSAISHGKDGVSLSDGSGQATLVTNNDSKLHLAASWNTTEWGVFGDGSGGEAFFGSGTTLAAQTALTATTSAAPACVKEGFTGETNNLSLAATPALGSEPSPTIASKQTNGTTGTANCAASTALQVSLGTLCNHQGVQINAQNGCPYKGETKIGTVMFHYLILIVNNDSSVYPAFWNLINFPRTSCQSVKLSFGMPASGSQRKDTAWIKVVTNAGVHSLSVKYGQVATLTATLGGDAWSLENSATNANDEIAINGTGNCVTRSGY